MKFQLYQPQAIYELGQRSNQEDSIYPRIGKATVDDRLFLVCDGMGGHDKGEVASAAVCSAMSQATQALLSADTPFTDAQFQSVLAITYDSLDAADVKEEGKMGTTMTFLCLHKGGALVAHIGDSRIYHLRPSTGEVLYRSRDHSLVQQLYELGELSYNGMKTSPRKNVIMRAMQPYQESRSKASLAHITDIRPGDYFYMCSDGMLEEMEDDELMSIMSSELSDEEKIGELIRRTEENKDNHSAYLVRIKEVVAEPGDELFSSDEAELRASNKALNDTRKDEAWDNSVPPVPQKEGEWKNEGPLPLPSERKWNQSGGQSASDLFRKYWPVLAFLVAAVVVALLLLFCGGKSDDASDDDATEPTESVQGGGSPSPSEGVGESTNTPVPGKPASGKEQAEPSEPDAEEEAIQQAEIGDAGNQEMDADGNLAGEVGRSDDGTAASSPTHGFPNLRQPGTKGK
ncbi:MAG: protein phosphatase 2C domain-containing protein [Prevotella sp.]|nr:protein phosphatase 2C domain-containing protein [Prevotella sp.]